MLCLCAVAGGWLAPPRADGFFLQDQPPPPASAVAPATPPAPATAPPALFPAGYADDEALGAALKRLAESNAEHVRIRSLAKTEQGRDVWLLTFPQLAPGSGVTLAEGTGPALLLTANLEGDHLVGAQVALDLARRLAKTDDPVVRATRERLTIYLAPRLNPDGAERVFQRPFAVQRGNTRAIDRDKDGKTNEDGPDDLDGDGNITMMRYPDWEKGVWVLADPKEPRVLRQADAGKGERGAFSVITEGEDQDGDGDVNEDPPGGVDLNRNWPQDWTEFDPVTGFSPASEPETRALIQFCYDHPEIAVVWTFALNDNLREDPKKPPVEDGDLPLMSELVKEYNRLSVRPVINASASATPAPEAGKDKEAEKAEKDEKADPKKTPAPELTKDAAKPVTPVKAGEPETWKPCGDGPVWEPTRDGTMSDWAYRQFGAVGISSRLWTSPVIPKESVPEGAKIPDHGETRWLFWNDHVMKGKAFVPLKSRPHKTLGTVEVGGWLPGVKLNPPATQIAAIADVQWAFLTETLAPKIAHVRLASIEVKHQGGEVYQITAIVENSGAWPTATARGVITRQAPPLLVRINPGGGRLLTGKALHIIPQLEGNRAKREFRWLLLAPEAEAAVTLGVGCPRAGGEIRVVPLRKPKAGGEPK